jgi:hypothetical protein
MARVIAYIDGFNLYYGLKSQRWERYSNGIHFLTFGFGPRRFGFFADFAFTPASRRMISSCGGLRTFRNKASNLAVASEPSTYSLSFTVS